MKNDSKKELLEILKEEMEELEQIGELVQTNLEEELKQGPDGEYYRTQQMLKNFEDFEMLDDDITDEELSRYIENYELNKKANRRKRIKTIAFNVMCTTAILSFFIFAAANSPRWGDVVNWGKKILNIPLDEKITDGNVDITKTDNTRTYNSITEAIEKENLDIIYPKVLPDSVIEKKAIVSENNDYIYIDVLYESPIEMLAFKIDNSKKDLNYDFLVQYIVGNVIHYITTNQDNTCFMWQLGEYNYNISYSGDKETLIEIIDSMY